MIIFEFNGSDVSQFDNTQAPDLTVTELIRRIVEISNVLDCDPTAVNVRYVP